MGATGLPADSGGVWMELCATLGSAVIKGFISGTKTDDTSRFQLRSHVTSFGKQRNHWLHYTGEEILSECI